MISFSYTDGLIEISIATWEIREWFYKKILNPICLFFGKDLYFIDCGYCERIKGQLMCHSATLGIIPCDKCAFDEE